MTAIVAPDVAPDLTTDGCGPNDTTYAASDKWVGADPMDVVPDIGCGFERDVTTSERECSGMVRVLS